VTVLAPTRLADALAALADDPSLVVLAGGTDLMVEVNYGHRRPEAVLSLRRLDELRGWRVDGDELVVGAGTSYAAMLDPAFVAVAPALAQAARTVGSPQIRSTGTIGGNLATASPAGDTLPVLVAAGARVDVASAAGARTVAVEGLLAGPKRTTLQPGELIVAVRLAAAAGPQEFLKVGVRNAMVIAVASCALVVDTGRRTVGCALGSVGPVPIRDRDAESWLTDRIDWGTLRLTDLDAAAGFGRRMAEASRPIDDHRATAAYRRHAVAVLATRAVRRAFP